MPIEHAAHPAHVVYLTLMACAAATLLAIIAAGPVLSGLPGPDAVARLSGRWAGPGTVTLTRGPSEAFKCVVTYLPASGQVHLQQNLRCSNENFKLDAATHLQFDGNHVTGRWEDKIHDLTGDVDGSLTPEGFKLTLGGRFFAATMDVTGDACAQSVKVAPTRGGDNIREIMASLRKC